METITQKSRTIAHKKYPLSRKNHQMFNCRFWSLSYFIWQSLTYNWLCLFYIFYKKYMYYINKCFLYYVTIEVVSKKWSRTKFRNVFREKSLRSNKTRWNFFSLVWLLLWLKLNTYVFKNCFIHKNVFKISFSGWFSKLF